MAQLQRLIIASGQRQAQNISLTEAQQHYLVRVLRLGKSDRFIAMDGQGNFWLSELDTSLRQAKILEFVHAESELILAVMLMAAMPKGNGFNEVVSQATELGVSCILPLKSDRTLLNPSPQRLQRWRRLTQEASEQSERQIVPTILDPLNFTDSLEMSKTFGTQRYICVARGNVPTLLSCLLAEKLQVKTPPKKPSVVIAIGPEGGWTKEEVEQATSAGFQAVSLGNRILRAVTAPIVALSLVVASLDG